MCLSKLSQQDMSLSAFSSSVASIKMPAPLLRLQRITQRTGYWHRRFFQVGRKLNGVCRNTSSLFPEPGNLCPTPAILHYRNRILLKENNHEEINYAIQKIGHHPPFADRPFTTGTNYRQLQPGYYFYGQHPQTFLLCAARLQPICACATDDRPARSW